MTPDPPPDLPHGACDETVFEIPHLTRDLPGVGGALKRAPEDFEVEEIPAYEPCGTGDHLFLWIEKRDVAAEDLIRHIALTLGVPNEQLGMAGLKDRHALTRQFVSVPCSARLAIGKIDTPEIRVHSVTPHTNKLRTGHLRGNRFRLVVRDVVAEAVARAEAIRQAIAGAGFPNFFGTQRFGRDGETAKLGRQLLRGEVQALPGHRAHQRFLRKLALSAAQALVFNRYLARRMHDRLLHTVLDGDVMRKRTGGIFYVTDQPAEQARFDRRETIHAGPIVGKKTFFARAAAAEREATILAEAGITPQHLRSFGPLLAGARRENLVYVDDLTVAPCDRALEFRFSLPAGSYATVLLGEFMKMRV